MSNTIQTPIDLIALVLRTSGAIGVGQTPDAQDANDCFILLNSMIAQWGRERWLVPNLLDVSCPSTGAQSYTLGPNMQFNTPRIDRLESAYARLLTSPSTNRFDFPLQLINSHEEYASITLKQLTTFPSSVFYDSGWPDSLIYVWPVPQAGLFDIHLIIKNTLTEFPSLTTPIVLPFEYIDCLVWNLTLRVAPLFQLAISPAVVALAKSSLAVIRSANTQIPELRMPGAILNRRSGYDVTLGNLNGLPFGGI